MSIGGVMTTSVSGMNAQASRLSTVSENIANSDTTGYKQSQTEFSSLILPHSGAGYNSGAVQAQVRTLVSQQGAISYTGNDNSPKKIDLAVSGNGFLPVGDGSDGTYLTRAGSFTQLSDGTLVNAAGFTLKGYPIGTNGTDAVLNGFAGLEEVNLRTSLLSANPTTMGVLTVPLDKGMTAQAGTHGTNTQAAVFAATSYTPAAATDYLEFQITVDGGTARTVTVPSTTVAGVAGITGAQIRDAINGTSGSGWNLTNVASLDANGKLVLTSNSTTLGTGSSVALGSIATKNVGATALSPAPTLTGFAPVTTSAGINPTFPSQNTALLPVDKSTISTSITVYNNSGEAVKLDIYYTKINDTTNTWEMTAFDSRKASTGTATSPFPYGTAGSAPLMTSTLDFSEDNYTLQAITPGPGASQTDNKILNIDLGPIGGGTFKLNIGDTTQYTGRTQPLAASVDGNPAEVIKTIAIGKDGTITASFASGTTRALFKIPLAMVNSPDSMTAMAGNVYAVGVESGTVLMGSGGSGGFGDITAGALENSTVDLATELTTMITAQRGYTANSKVFQTGSEILDVLVNLKR